MNIIFHSLALKEVTLAAYAQNELSDVTRKGPLAGGCTEVSALK